MRRAKRPLVGQPGAGRQHARRPTGSPCTSSASSKVSGGQDARQPARQHRLAGAGRADQQQVMAPGRGHFERPLGRPPVPADRRGRPPPRPCRAAGRRFRAAWATRRIAAQTLDSLGQRAHRDDADATRRRPLRWRCRPAPATPRCPGAAGRAATGSTPRVAQHGAVERQLADDRRGGAVGAGRTPSAARMATRDRQVERGAGLAHVGRREIDRDAMGRKVEAGVPDRRPHAIAALAHAGVGEADHREERQAEGDVDFDGHRVGVDPDRRRRTSPEASTLPVCRKPGAAAAGPKRTAIGRGRQTAAAEGAEPRGAARRRFSTGGVAYWSPVPRVVRMRRRVPMLSAEPRRLFHARRSSTVTSWRRAMAYSVSPLRTR